MTNSKGDDRSHILIQNRYKVLAKLGKGTFGIIYQGVDVRTNEKVAIKLEKISVPEPLLSYEAIIYGKLQRMEGISRLHWSGVQDDYNVLILDMLGPTLEDLFHFCNQKFSQQTICWLGYQMLNRIEQIHEMNYVH